MAKTTCRDCNRTVVMVRIGADLVATDPELITVVPARDRRTDAPSSGSALDAGNPVTGIVMASRQTFARRVHAERCSDYREQARKDRLSAELRAYNRKHGTKNRNHGL